MAKKRTFYGEFKDARTGNLRILSDVFLEEFCAKIIERVETSRGDVTMLTICHELGVNHKVYQDWIKKHPIVAETDAYAKLLIGSLREIYALRKELDVSLAKFTNYHYLPQYAEIQKLINSLDDIKATIDKINVVMRQYPKKDTNESDERADI